MKEPTEKDWAKVFGVEQKLEELKNILYDKLKEKELITDEEIAKIKSQKNEEI